VIPERLEQKIVRVPESGCWIWTGALHRNGYGHFKIPNSRSHLLAHRGVYAIERGEIPEGMDLDHLCRVRCCVNPDHLEPVTRRENLRRGGVIDQLRARAAAANAATHCKRGHPMTPENTYVYPKSRHRACRICQLAANRRNAWKYR